MIVYILGCGPAGLLAAHAVEQWGGVPVIVSKKVKSQIPGAVFLHEAIPGLTTALADGVVKFSKHGTKQGYAEKVYGHGDADCSWDLFPEGERPAWSMFAAYNKLWDRYHDKINNILIRHDHLPKLQSGRSLVISTIPAPFLCYNEDHTFRNQGIYVLDKTTDPSLDNGIVYNGSQRDAWYRTSKLFGAEATESTSPFPIEVILGLGAAESKGYKPIETNCDCYPNVKRIGRFGRWEKGILVHHAYKQAVQIMEGLA